MAGGATLLADQSADCVLLPFNIPGGGKRYVTLGGFPDAWMSRDQTTTGGFVSLTDAAVTNLNTFYAHLLESPALQVRKRNSSGGNAKLAISAITEHEDGQYQITTAAAHGYAQGDKVTLTKIKGNNLIGLGGQRKVTLVPSATTLLIDRGPRADLGDVTYLAGGFVQKVVYEFVTCTEAVEPYGISTRKRGRPFSKRRGRRSKSR